MSAPALSPLAIALQGLGFGTWLTAVQGLFPVETGVPAEPLQPSAVQAAAPVRRRVRRFAGTLGLNTPLKALKKPAQDLSDTDDEEVLLLLGVL